MDLKERVEAVRREHYPHIARLMDRIFSGQVDPLLQRMCRYQLTSGGKRLRAVVPVILAETLGVAPEQVYHFAAACEMLHNATLVHDDVQDGDYVRRDRATVWAMWGKAQAINLGDAMFFFGSLLLHEIDATPSMRLKILKEYAECTTRVISGQVEEFKLKEADSLHLTDYFDMVEKKTSALFSLPLVGTARLARAPGSVQRGLAKAALHLGVIFQIQDDLLDLWGNKGRDQPGSDLREGKISILAAHTLCTAPKPLRERLTTILRTPRSQTTPELVSEATAIFERVGSRDHALKEIRLRQGQIEKIRRLAKHPETLKLVIDLSTVFISPIDHLFTGPAESA